MRSKSILAFAVSCALATAVLAQKTAEPKASEGGTPIFIPASALKWADLNPTGAPGVKIADVWGDHAKGGYGAFLKFPAGFLSPLHTHTYDIKIVVISGTYTQAPEGKSAARLGKGSYAFQPGGSYKHISGCAKASDCVLFIESTGPFDLLPVAGAAK
jgi:anti-sigma factor ChrR (cupin superfamily)